MLIADEVADAAAAVLVTVDMVMLPMLDIDMDMVFGLLLAEIRLEDGCQKRQTAEELSFYRDRMLFER